MEKRIEKQTDTNLIGVNDDNVNKLKFIELHLHDPVILLTEKLIIHVIHVKYFI